MTWEKFLAGEIHIDHIRPRMDFSIHRLTMQRFMSVGLYRTSVRCGPMKITAAAQAAAVSVRLRHELPTAILHLVGECDARRIAFVLPIGFCMPQLMSCV